VLQDTNAIESLLPIISEKRIKIEEASIYQVKAFSGITEYSVSFPSTLLDEDGMFWLPLFQSSNDYIEALLEDVNDPRVLILVHKKSVEEGKSQLVTEESAQDYEFMPEIKLEYSENPYSSQDLCPETPLLLLKSVEASEDFQNPLTNEKMLEISIHYQETLNTHKSFTEKILQDLEEKNSQLSNALNEISALSAQVRRLESENNYLRAMNNGFITAQITELVSQVELFKTKAKQLETEKYSNSGQLENLLKAECEKFNIEPVKDEEEVFLLNGKKFLISLKNGKVVCRVGNIFKDFRQALMENKNENKNAVNNLSKNCFRKNLAELNASVETPRSSSRLNENSFNGKTKKTQGVKRVGQLRKG
jgi:hypothetical protein